MLKDKSIEVSETVIEKNTIIYIWINEILNFNKHFNEIFYSITLHKHM